MMDENSFLHYNTLDGCETIDKINEIVRVVLDEQKHILSEEDRQILRDHENLQNELHVLQNVNHVEEAGTNLSSVRNFSDDEDPLISSKSDVYFVDVEAIEQPSLTLENIEPNNADLDNTIANFIQDENIKLEVLRLNEQIEINSLSIRTLSAEAKNLLVEKLNLKRKLANIERKIATFSSEDAKIKRIKRKKGTDSASTGHLKRTYFYRFGAPYFKTKERYPADHNPDLMEIIRTDQPMMLRFPRVKRFLPHDASSLDRSILKQLKAKRVEQLKKCLKQAEERLNKKLGDEKLGEDVRCIERTIRETENVSHISATKDWNIPVDFMALPYSNRFSSDDYERIWRLTGCPSLSRAEFSDDEISELQMLVKKYNKQNWDSIASEMSSQRSGFMCFTKYAAIQKKGKNIPWTKEENELLYNLCISLDFVSKSDSRYQYWKSIRVHFPNRSYSQIHSHWTYVLEPRLKKGRFTTDEHRLMQTLVKQGKTFREIAQLVRNRTCVQIRSHFEALEYTKMNRGNWTAEEENKLLSLVDKYGSHDWVKISNEMVTRNRSQCRLKYLLFRRNDRRFSTGTRAPKEYWSAEENHVFKQLLRKYGTDFRKMSQEMVSKTYTQLRYKYHRSKGLEEYRELVAAISKSPKHRKTVWSDEDIEYFKELLVKYGVQYQRISKIMQNKTALQLRYKFCTMKDKWKLDLPPVSSAFGDRYCGGPPKSKRRKPKPKISNVESLPAYIFEDLIHATEVNARLPVNVSSEGSVVTSIPPHTAIYPPTTALDTSVSRSHVQLSNNSQHVTNKVSVQSSGHEEPSAVEGKLCEYEQKSSSLKSTSKTVWTSEEVEIFKNYITMYGPLHTKISGLMPGKTRTQLQSKYNSIKKKWNPTFPPLSIASKGKSKKSHAETVLTDTPDERTAIPKKRRKSLPAKTASCDELSTHTVKPAARQRKKVPPLDPIIANESSHGFVKQKTRTRKKTESTKRAKYRNAPFLKTVAEEKPSDGISKLKGRKRKNATSTKTASFGDQPVNLVDCTASKRKPRRSKKASQPMVYHHDSLSIMQHSQPLPIKLFENPNIAAVSENLALLSAARPTPSCLSRLTDTQEEFPGFPDEVHLLPVTHQNLIPINRFQTMEPGLSSEQMIVPEMISEMPPETNDLSPVNVNLANTNAVIDGVVDVMNESCVNENVIKQEQFSPEIEVL